MCSVCFLLSDENLAAMFFHVFISVEVFLEGVCPKSLLHVEDNWVAAPCSELGKMQNIWILFHPLRCLLVARHSWTCCWGWYRQCQHSINAADREVKQHSLCQTEWSHPEENLERCMGGHGVMWSIGYAPVCKEESSIFQSKNDLYI